MNAGSGQRSAYYVDTPSGLFTAAGHWFRTTETLLRSYAGPLLEKEPLDRLLRQADTWLRFPAVLMLWTLLPLLWVWEPVRAVGTALGLYLLSNLLLPLLILRPLTPILTGLATPWLQGAAYVVGLTVLAWQENFSAVWMGLGAFVLVRWGVLDRLLRPLLDRAATMLYRLPLPDQVLRSLILRAALTHRIPLPELQVMEQEVLRRLRQLPWNRN